MTSLNLQHELDHTILLPRPAYKSKQSLRLTRKIAKISEHALTIEAQIITDTILGVLYYEYSITYPNPILIIKILIL